VEKPARNEHLIDDLLVRRWSPRAFSERPVSSESVRSLLEAARWAPSCFNEQPWSFIVATREEPEAFEKLLGCLRATNQAWAKRAAVLMVAVAKGAFDHNGKPNRHGVPEGHDPLVAVAVGYPGNLEDLPEEFRERELAPRERKSLGLFVFGLSWGDPWDGLKSHEGELE
jgi:nitroreductase